MNHRFAVALLAFLFVFTTGCDDDDSTPLQTYTYDFSTNTEGWSGEFADYPFGEEEFYELDFRHTRLPAPLDTLEGALLITGNNHSDDLFMFVKHRVEGLAPRREYQLKFTLRFASAVADNLVGVGGSPGESVYLKAGASATEPLKVLDPTDDHYRMNIDKGNQAQDGADMINIGDFSNDTDLEVHRLVTRTHSEPFTASTDAQGRLWIYFGSDSGFEATTNLIIDRIEVEVSEMPR